MRRIFLIGTVSLILTGCVAVSSTPISQNLSTSVRKNLIPIEKVRVGMTTSEVAGILGKDLKTGYVKSNIAAGAFEPITIPQPYRVAILKAREKQYDVYFYYSAVDQADEMVSEDELVPVIFDEGRVVGVGRDFLFKLQPKS